MTFEEWFENYLKEWGHNFYDDFTFADMQRAFDSGWNACRDTWSGMDYDETFNP